MAVVCVKTEVLPGHRVEVSVPDLSVGETVEVTVNPAPVEPPRRSALDMLEEIHAGPPFKTSTDEMIRSLEEDRASWDA